jgi:small subunit ribosomal protein S18
MSYMSMERRPKGTIVGKDKNCEQEIPNYKEVEMLRKFLSSQGQILSRKRTGYCAQCQKLLKQSIKQARHLGLLPFVG